MEIAKSLYGLLSKRERRQLYFLFPAIILMGLLEVVGIASFAPFLSLVSNPDAIEENRYLGWLYQTFNFSNTNSFLIFVGVAVLVILTLTNGFSMLVNYALIRFSWMRNYSISQRLIERYMSRPYIYYLSRNTADMGKTLLQEVQQVIKGVMVPAMQLVAYSVVALFILILIIVVNPLIALVAAVVLAGAYTLIFLGVRRNLARIGRGRVKANGSRFQAANEAFGGIKDIKVLGREQEFVKRFAKPSKRFSNYVATSSVISAIPSKALETIAFGGMIAIVIYLLATKQNLSQVLPLLGIYAFASYRLLPSLQKIFGAVTSIRFYAAALEELEQDLEGANKLVAQGEKLTPLPFRERLDIENLTFAYPGSAPVLKGVNLTIRPNTSVAFVGSTGSGKTTLIDIILGLLEPQVGRLLVDGKQVDETTLARWQKNMGYVAQQIFLCDSTITRNIAFGVPENEIDRAAVERAARIAMIHDFIGTLPGGYDTVVGERGVRLSGGQRQRLGIARALYHDPEILILDEATSALDSVTEESVSRTIANVAKAKTMLIIAHRMTTVRDCDIIYLLDKGRVVAQGSYYELVETNEQFRAMAQVKLEADAGERLEKSV